ncbi:phage tail sheath subtilisin-like domain-containing protein (plasmid) [Tistrella mobilis]|uniref:phage tail sheath subtilisin-like domain-containing protein n=1 Tax=Tistrella mobilis TaxID=171437 RepID=UPI003558FC90
MATDFLHGIEVLEVDDGIRPIQTVRSSVIGLIGTAPDAVAADWPLDTPVLVTNRRRLAGLGDSGSLPKALAGIYDQAGAVVAVIRVTEGTDEADTLGNVAGSSLDGTGVHALKAAQAVLGASPRILIATGFTHQGTDGGTPANPVVAALLSVAPSMRAVVIADGPATTTAAALTYGQSLGSDRLFVVDPKVMVWSQETDAAVAEPASARVAGLIARIDNERGFWWSPSNHEIAGIVGISRPVDFALSDSNSESNLLNEAKIATIIRNNGFRLWGNRTTAQDPLWQFLPVRRTADLIYDSIERALLWAMDRPLSRQLFADIEGSVNAYLRELIALGAIVGGKAWLDPDLNTPATLQAGKLYVDFDIEPPAPLERLTFRAHRNAEYWTEALAV